MCEGVIIISRQPGEIITDKGLNWVKSRNSTKPRELETPRQIGLTSNKQHLTSALNSAAHQHKTIVFPLSWGRGKYIHVLQEKENLKSCFVTAVPSLGLLRKHLQGQRMKAFYKDRVQGLCSTPLPASHMHTTHRPVALHKSANNRLFLKWGFQICKIKAAGLQSMHAFAVNDCLKWLDGGLAK